MSNSPAHGDLKRPSEAYREATSSLVYRLSELMFGSLLAAYSLGFVGAVASQIGQLSQHGRVGVALLATQYICISIMATYLTTSFYITYHVGVLTLPRYPFDLIGGDFGIAVFQAIFFGLSLLKPALFPILLAVNILISTLRKEREYRRLAGHLFITYCLGADRDVSKDLPEFRRALKKSLRSQRHLSAWAPLGRWTISLGVLALIVGAIVFRISEGLERGNISTPNWLSSFVNYWQTVPMILTPLRVSQTLVALELLLATGFVFWHGLRSLKRNAGFTGFPIKNLDFCRYQGDTKVEHPGKAVESQPPSDDSDNHQEGTMGTKKKKSIDEEFLELPKEVKRICNELFAHG